MFINKYEPSKGKFLVSEPFLDDPNFRRTVVLLVEHNEEGSLGYVLNKKLKITLGQVIEGLNFDAHLYLGGPVGHNTLNFLHQIPDRIEGGKEIADSVFWGGNFEQVKQLIHCNLILPHEILFLVGYSGWGKGQLEREIVEKTWIVAPENSALVFEPDHKNLWKEVLKSMDEFKHLSNYPIDPNLN